MVKWEALHGASRAASRWCAKASNFSCVFWQLDWAGDGVVPQAVPVTAGMPVHTRHITAGVVGDRPHQCWSCLHAQLQGLPSFSVWQTGSSPQGLEVIIGY